jgi:hypothetical protein
MGHRLLNRQRYALHDHRQASQYCLCCKKSISANSGAHIRSSYRRSCRLGPANGVCKKKRLPRSTSLPCLHIENEKSSTHQTTVSAYEITTGELLNEIALLSAVWTVDADVEIRSEVVAGCAGGRCSAGVGLHGARGEDERVCRYSNVY